MLEEEFDDQWFNGWILEEADTTAACVEPTCFWIPIESEVQVVTATNNRMKTVRRMYFVDRIGQKFCLFVWNEFIVGAVNNEDRRFVLMYIADWTGIAPQLLTVLVLRSEQPFGKRRKPRQVGRSKQINSAGNITGLIEIFPNIEQSFSTGRSQHRHEMASGRLADDCYFIRRITVVVSARFKPPDCGLTILDLRRPECMLHEAIINRRHGVTLPKPLEIVGIDTISCLFTMLKTAAMDIDHERFTVTISRNIKVQLLFRSTARHIGNINDPRNTL